MIRTTKTNVLCVAVAGLSKGKRIPHEYLVQIDAIAACVVNLFDYFPKQHLRRFVYKQNKDEL